MISMTSLFRMDLCRLSNHFNSKYMKEQIKTKLTNDKELAEVEKVLDDTRKKCYEAANTDRGTNRAKG